MTVPNEHDREAGHAVPPGAQEEEAADVAALQASLAAAESRALESRDLYMRALAELENVRKRASRDVEQAHKFALERIAIDLIAVKDSLELGLANASPADKLREGTEATLKLLSKALEKAGDDGAAFPAARAELDPASRTEGLPAEWPPAAAGSGDRRKRALAP
jgi:molecular chaperone GrpE